MRLASGEEALLAIVLTRDGRVGYGFDPGLDATAARHMAMRAAGLPVTPGDGCSPRA